MTQPKRAISTKLIVAIAIGIVISLILSGIGFYKSLDSVPYDSQTRLKEVNDKHFVNEEVAIDGKKFSRCTFESVTLVYKGRGPFGMMHCIFTHPIILKTRNPALSSFMGLLKGAGFLKGNLRDLEHGLDQIEPVKEINGPPPPPDT